MKAKIDNEACIGCELCVQSCPDVFKMESDKAIVCVDVVPGGAEDSCKKAQEECPVTAITVE